MKMRFYVYVLLVFFVKLSFAQDSRSEQRWIDEKTSREVVRIAAAPYSTFPYFTANAFSHDKQLIFYVSSYGIEAIEMETLSTRKIYQSNTSLWFIGASRTDSKIYFLSKTESGLGYDFNELEIYNSTLRKIGTIPNGYRVETLNSDSTLAAGVFQAPDETDATSKSVSRGAKLYLRGKEDKDCTLFTINLKSGKIKNIYNSKEWLSHPQFSPTNPNLLMYSVEGPWHLVDRIWTIKPDGSERQLVHHRTMQMEIAGHEFWSVDGNLIIYDWQYPKGRSFFIATYDVSTKKRKAYPINANEWSLHFNSSTNSEILIGDGANRLSVAKTDQAAFIRLYSKRASLDDAQSSEWSIGEMKVEELVDMQAHDYRLEPNARISPNNKWVFFRSNIFGPPAIFAVSVMKSASNLEKISTTALSKKIKDKYKKTLMLDE